MFWDVFCILHYIYDYMTYLYGDSTADHVNLLFGIKWPPGRNEAEDVSGIKEP